MTEPHAFRDRATTGIEWTEHTWNPFVGCFIVSAGCKNCYAMSMAARLQGSGLRAYQGTVRNGVWTGQVNRNSDTAMAFPLKLKRPSLVFVNSMSDFWHANADDAWRAEALAIMERLPQHRFQILTKRPENIAPIMARMGLTRMPDNVWLGCTLEDHRVADRAKILAAVPARVRFLSCEPITARVGPLELAGIHWVITGGESGKRPRLCRPDWVREVRDQCQAQGVPLFHKQWGTYASNPIVIEQGLSRAEAEQLDPPANGKGGGLLDGRLWREFPENLAANPAPGGPQRLL
jgi:protein gp37